VSYLKVWDTQMSYLPICAGNGIEGQCGYNQGEIGSGSVQMLTKCV
jgi:hypothetical protein